MSPTNIYGHARQGVADKKMNKNNGYPLRKPLLCAGLCATSVLNVLSLMADQSIYEVGMNDPSEA